MQGNRRINQCVPSSGQFDSESGTHALIDVSLESVFPRDEFPLLARPVGRDGQQLVYLDSAASSLVPDRVLEAVRHYYHTSCSNIHRGAHRLAEESTDAFERARENVAAFLGIRNEKQVVFTHGSTESLNMASRCWAACALRPGDTVVVAEDNHHANIICWHMVAQEYGFKLEWIPLGRDSFLDYAHWCRLLELKPKLVALVHHSNVLGYEQPFLRHIINDARQAGVKVVLDAAQSVGHIPLSFPDLSVDFLAFSAHKVMGLTGLGVLACSLEVLEDMRPVYGGGGMLERVDRKGFLPHQAPFAFEAGTPSIVAAIACAEALSMIEEAGLDAVAHHTESLCAMIGEGLASHACITVLGDTALKRNSLIAFTIEGVHPHDASQMLSDCGIAVRAGHHCAMPLHKALQVPASIRVSVAGYSNSTDVEGFLNALATIIEKRL